MNKLLLFVFLGFCTLAKAQEKKKEEAPPPKFKKTVTLQIEGGTQGAGADVRYSFMPKLSARLGVGILPVNVNNVFDVTGFSANNSLAAKFDNIHLLADFTPFKGAQWFRIVGGAGYFFKADGNVKMVPNRDNTVGDLTITPEEEGELDVNVTWKKFAPYLGIGLFKAVPSNVFNVNLDIGMYYLSSPNTVVTGTNLLADNGSQAAQINQNLKDYRFFPVLQLNFNFKL
jgi:hypothetical protein